MKLRDNTRKKTQSGSVLIEFALFATLVTILAVGAVSFGLAIQQSIIVADASNAGALFGTNNTYNISYTGRNANRSELGRCPGQELFVHSKLFL